MKLATIQVTWCVFCPNHREVISDYSADYSVCALVEGDGWAGKRKIIAEKLPFTFPIWCPLPDAVEAEVKT